MTRTLRAHVAANVRAARVEAGLSTGQLATRMRDQGFRWWPSRVSRVETGALPVTLETLLGIAIALDVPIVDLLAGPAIENLGTVDLTDRVQLYSSTIEDMLDQRPSRART